MPKPLLTQPVRLINVAVSMWKSVVKLYILLKNDNEDNLEHMNTWDNFDVKRQYIDPCRQYLDPSVSIEII